MDIVIEPHFPRNVEKRSIKSIEMIPPTPFKAFFYVHFPGSGGGGIISEETKVLRLVLKVTNTEGTRHCQGALRGYPNAMSEGSKSRGSSELALARQSRRRTLHL